MGSSRYQRGRFQAHPELCDIAILDTYGYRKEEWQEPSEWTAERISEVDGFVLAFDTTKYGALADIKGIYERVCEVKTQRLLRKNTGPKQILKPALIGRTKWPIVLVGNKCDDSAGRKLLLSECRRVAQELGCKFFEASAKDNINIEEVFAELTRRLIQELGRKPEAQK